MAEDVLEPEKKDEAPPAEEKKAAGSAPTAPAAGGVKLPEVACQLKAVLGRLAFLRGYCLVASRWAVILGLFIIVLARGCDAVGRRSAAAAQARARVAKNEFDDRWTGRTAEVQADIDVVQARINELQAIAQPNDDQKKELENKKKALDEARKKLEALGKDRDKERRELENDRWRDYDIDARDANDRQQIKGVGRERWFVFGSLILVFGLLGLSISGSTGEKWAALIVLAIILLCYYGGAIRVGAA